MPIDEIDGLLGEDLLRADDRDEIETDHMATARSIRMHARRRTRRLYHKQMLLDVCPEPPAPGESIHIIGNGHWNFWTWAPQMLEWAGGTDHFYASTWTAARHNVNEFLELWDAGQFRTASILTGLYFKRRETAVFALWLDGIRKRGGRFRAARNHTKIICIKGRKRPTLWLTCESSANFTSNPRHEQYVFTNDRGLYEFYVEWFEEMITA